MGSLPFHICWYFVFLFSVTLHEAAHSWAALLGGDATAYYGGQVSLSPMPHIRRQPFGMVVLPILSLWLFSWPLGFASAPYDPLWASRYPKRAAWMSLAGPLSNACVVIVCGALMRLGILMGTYAPVQDVGFPMVVLATQEGWHLAAALLLNMLFGLNLLLLVLNLIPLPPLDGSGAVLFFLSHEGVIRYQNLMRQPLFAWGGLFLAWHLFGIVFTSVFDWAAALVVGG